MRRSSLSPAPTPLAMVLAALTLLVLACSGGVSSKNAAGSILIGGVGPLSKPGAVEGGQDMKWAMETAVADLNSAGGVLGRKLALDFEDTEGKPDVAATVATRLVGKKVTAVVGEYHSGAALAMIPAFEQAGTPVVFSETYNNKITQGDPSAGLPANPPNIFRIAPSSSYDGSFMTDWLINGLKAKSVIEFHEASDYGIGQRDTLKQQLAGTGIKLTQIEVQLQQPDYSSILARAKQDTPVADVVIFDVTGDSSYQIEQNAHQVGLTSSHTVCVADQAAQDSQAFWRSVPDGAGCAFRYYGPVPSQYNALARSVADRYQGRFNQSAKAWVFEAYDSVRLVADAIRSAGSTEPGKIVQALENTHFEGCQGRYEFPYGAANPVPSDKPGWLWHQWPNPPVQMVEYSEKRQPITQVVVIWPGQRQSKPGTAYVPVGG